MTSQPTPRGTDMANDLEGWEKIPCTDMREGDRLVITYETGEWVGKATTYRRSSDPITTPSVGETHD